MKRVFVALLLTLVFAVACDNGSSVGDGLLTITSKTQIICESEGGVGQIEYTLEGATDVQNIKAVTEAEWIENIEVGATISYNVLENSSEEPRTAKLVVSYGKQTVDITIYQKGYVPAYQLHFEAGTFNASYYGKVGSTGFNFPVVLSDIGVPSPVNQYYGSKQYYLDLYSDVGYGFRTDVVPLPDGVYTYDHQSKGLPGTFASKFSSYVEVSESGNIIEYRIIDGTVTVENGSIEALVCLENGDWHYITYEGELVTGYEYQANITPPYSLFNEDYDFNITNGYIRCYYRGDFYGLGYDVWYISMIESKSPFSGLYLMFEILVDKSRGGYKENAYLGEYKVCKSFDGELDSFIPGRLRDASIPVNTWAMRCKDGMTLGDWGGPIADGVISFTEEDGDYVVTFDCKDDAGHAVKGTFKGILGEHMNQSPELDVDDDDIAPANL